LAIRLLTGVASTSFEPAAPDAVETYRAAGSAALLAVGSWRWHHWRIHVTSDWAFDTLLSQLAPVIRESLKAGTASHWWFLRKTDGGAHLRLRVAGPEPALSDEVLPVTESRLRALRDRSFLTSWVSMPYEPEQRLFGGPDGLELAHDFFRDDTLHVLAWLDALQASPDRCFDRRMELCLLVVQAMMLGAGLDKLKQWEVWARLRLMRPWPHPSMGVSYLRNRHRLAQILDSPDLLGEQVFGTAGSRLVASWRTTAAKAGGRLRRLDVEGCLTRRLPEVVVAHAVFHWNMVGLRYRAMAASAAWGERLSAED